PLLTNVLPDLGVRPEVVDGTDDRGLTVAHLDIVLGVAWAFVLGIIVPVIGEAVVPTGSLPTPLQLLEPIPARRPRGQRYPTLMPVAARLRLGGVSRPRRRSAPPATAAGPVREAMTEAGVNFVKLGQMLGARAVAVPEPLLRDLCPLLTSLPPE